MRAALVRNLVLDVYARVTEQGELADRALNRALRSHADLHSHERRYVATSLYAMIRMQRRFDYLLDAALLRDARQGLASLATPDIHRLKYAAALIHELSETPQNAAHLAEVAQARLPALEAIRSSQTTWPEEPATRLSVEESFPLWVARQLIAEYADRAAPLAHALNSRAPLTLRANTLKTTAAGLQEALQKEEVAATLGTLSPWAVMLSEHHNVFGLSAYKSGWFDVQDEGSQLVALASGAVAGNRVIDACCGSGGKTLALAAMMANKGLILACDVNERRMEDLRPRARQAGVFNLEPHVVPEGPDGDRAVKRWRGRADVVLVDAPCSGSGAWRRHPDARWRLQPADVERFSGLQRAILQRYAVGVKPGGRLVYATCSIFAAENEQVAEAFLSEAPAFRAEPLTGVPPQALDAVGRLRVLPDTHGTDGFFAASFRRVEP
jgi:16S rRNA (cytosine967-C5)-methyltransferase